MKSFIVTAFTIAVSIGSLKLYRSRIPAPLETALLSASHVACCTACHRVRSHPVPVALVAECSIPVV
jgi:hypothetical protein